MLKAVNIWRICRGLILILSVCLLLAACNGTEGGSSPQKNTPFGSSQENEDEVAAKQRTCWQSGMLELLYDNMGKTALTLYGQITDGAMAFMMVAFAVWFSFRLMKHLSSMQEENIPELWNEVLRQLFLCIVCGLIANSSTMLFWLLNHVLFPIYYAFLEFGGEMLTAAAVDNNAGVSLHILGERLNFGQAVACRASALVTNDNMTSFPEGPIIMLKCMTCNINERLSVGMGISFKTLWDAGLMALFVGLFIYLIFLFLKLGFVFYMVDTLFRFTVMAAILPILVMAYAFKQTRSWTTNGFYAIINSAAYMMFIAFMLAVAMLAIEQILQLDELGLVGDRYESFKEAFQQMSVQFLSLLLMAFLVLSTMKIAGELTSQLVGGSAESNFAKTAGGLAASLAKAAFIYITGGVGKFALRFAKIRKAKDKADNVKDKIAAPFAKFKNQMDKWAGRQ